MRPLYVCYCRSGVEDGRNVSIFKFDLAFGLKNRYANSIACSKALDGTHPFSRQVKEAFRLLSGLGLNNDAERRIRAGKHVRVMTDEIPSDVMRGLGFNVKRYPHKYLPVTNPESTFGRVRTCGFHIDASNILFNRFNSKGVLTVKAVVDWCIERSVNWHLYLDSNTMGCLHANDTAGYNYLQWFYNHDVDGERRINIPPHTSKKTADDFMFDFADKGFGDLCSRDEFDEWDYLGWTLNGAESGVQRLHKFWTTDTTVRIPDIGLCADIPSHF